MRLVRALVVLLVLGTSLAAGYVSVVSAATNPFQQACSQPGAGGPACTSNGGNDPIAGSNGAIVSVTSILAAVAGIVAIVTLIWGGFKYITSDGDSSNVSSAKQTIIASLVGLVIAALARPIVVFIVSKL